MEKQISVRLFGVIKFNIFIVQEIMKRVNAPNQSYLNKLEDLSDSLEGYLVKWMGIDYMMRSFEERENPFMVGLSESKAAFEVLSDKFKVCDEIMWDSTPDFTPKYPIDVISIHEEMKKSLEKYRKCIEEVESGTP